MTYLTGDTHRNFRKTTVFCDIAKSSKEDILIILGDTGINYCGGSEDRALKKLLSELPITLFCIHGNHEQRPESIPSYKETEWHGGRVYYESEFPNLLFANDGDVYELNGKRCIAIGGAYSVDKYYRTPGVEWWADEQPSKEIMQRVEKRLDAENWNIDIVLSHTCPFKYIPKEVFLSSIDQNTVDDSTEKWLDTIESRLAYSLWYCGHYHTYKVIDRMRFLYEEFIEL